MGRFTVGTNHSGGDTASNFGDMNAGGANVGGGSFNTYADLSSLQSISGHTINDGLDAQDTAYLFSAIAGNAVEGLSTNAKKVWTSFINSTGFKLAMVSIGMLVAYFIFFRKRGR